MKRIMLVRSRVCAACGVSVGYDEANAKIIAKKKRIATEMAPRIVNNFMIVLGNDLRFKLSPFGKY